MTQDPQWPVARLIPSTTNSGVQNRERRAASALLAVMAAVPEFGRAILKSAGVPSGRIDAFVEVPLRLGDRLIRPDGVLKVSRGKSTWSCLVEVKVASAPLTEDQVLSYVALAKASKADALLTISNLCATASRLYPLTISPQIVGSLEVHHVCWREILKDAAILQKQKQINDPDQAFILTELVRYLNDPRSGVTIVENMGRHWKQVWTAAASHTVDPEGDAVTHVVHRWDDLVRYICFDLSTKLGREVDPSIDRTQRENSNIRAQALAADVAANGTLTAAVKIPGTVADLQLSADLRGKNVTISTRLAAPAEGRNRTKVKWVVRQLSDAPAELLIQSHVAYQKVPVVAALGSLRENPDLVVADKTREIKAFTVSLTRGVGFRSTGGKGSFIEGVKGAAEQYYEDVLRHLSDWKQKGPILEPLPTGTATLKEGSGLSEEIQTGLQRAQIEMDRQRDTTSTPPEPPEAAR